MKKILKSICFSLLFFMFAIGSIFLPIGKQNQNFASADVTSYATSFTGSNIISARSGYSDAGVIISKFSDLNSSWLAALYFNFSFKLDLDKINSSQTGIKPYIKASFNDNIFWGYTGSTEEQFMPFVEQYVDNNGIYSNIYQPQLQYFYVVGQDEYCWACFMIDRVGTDGVPYYNYSQTINIADKLASPTLVMKSIEIGNYTDLSVMGYSSANSSIVGFHSQNYQFLNNVCDSSFNFVCYTDTNNFRYWFILPSATSFTIQSESEAFYGYRRYYLVNDVTNNDYYNQGVSNGYQTGYENGYSVGLSTGYDNGFENGKIEGALESNNYSFFGLFSAVIDAPVKILTSLFNFNFLGVNLWAFFTSILTISLIIFVIRKFMAKG